MALTRADFKNCKQYSSYNKTKPTDITIVLFIFLFFVILNLPEGCKEPGTLKAWGVPRWGAPSACGTSSISKESLWEYLEYTTAS